MYRLNDSAFKILRSELLNCGSNNDIGRKERQIVAKRFEKLRKEKGSPITFEELLLLVVDVFPDFSEKAIRKAVKANQPPGIFSDLKWVAIVVASIGGAIWLVNLPLPMIRKPVAEKAPFLLLPSYISMDNGYREAIGAIEQADRLINNATSLEDIKQSSEKVKQAQRSLDDLPTQLLGYYPQVYCGLFECTWEFTVDEFETARRRVARIDAQAFQEKNAFESVKQAEETLKVAKQQYEEAKNTGDKKKAIAQMQTAMITLLQIPRQTLAGKKALTIIAVSQPDLAKIIAKDGKSGVSGNLIEAAKVFAMQAAQASQNPPHPTYKWEQVEKLWLEAIKRLRNIDATNPNYLEAQKLLAKYQSNQGIIQTRLQAERESQKILNQAEVQIERFIANPPSELNQYKARLQTIVSKLKTVQSGTTSYKRAQELISSIQKQLKE
ncbi:hypothetical protein [Calothrix sp. CCY 0018]|uniref:hypothetical protein n=1 Tax=Calothrix sp. CCY 0018 TaxID=3103864 RepID=UPI0039C6709D